MTSDLGPWSRLIEEHRQNLARLDAERPEGPPWWTLPLGFALPWGCFVAASLSQQSNVVIPAVVAFAGLVPFGLVCLFVKELQTVAVGIALGIVSSGAAAVVLFGGPGRSWVSPTERRVGPSSRTLRGARPVGTRPTRRGGALGCRRSR